MSKVYESATHWTVECPASGHIEIPKDGRWIFNGDYERPSFHPSVNETRGKVDQTLAEMASDPNVWRNHVFIRDGHIEYLSDCTHEFAGRTVEIPALNEAREAMLGDYLHSK
jgi:hypothetical protein